MGQLTYLQIQIFEINKEKGWFDKPVSFGELIALIHSEASEALQYYRDGEPEEYLADELADIVIRALDTAQRIGFVLEPYILRKIARNAERPYRHGNKRL